MRTGDKDGGIPHTSLYGSHNLKHNSQASSIGQKYLADGGT